MASEPFKSLEDVQAEKLRLRAALNERNERMRAHLTIVRDPQFRKELMSNAFNEAIRSVRPLRAISTIFSTEKGAVGNILGTAIGSRGKTFKGKALGWAVGLAIPFVLKVFMTNDRSEHIAHELRRTFERVRDRIMGEHEEA